MYSNFKDINLTTYIERLNNNIHKKTKANFKKMNEQSGCFCTDNVYVKQ